MTDQRDGKAWKKAERVGLVDDLGTPWHKALARFAMGAAVASILVLLIAKVL